MNLVIDIGNTRTKYYAFKHYNAVVQDSEEGCSLAGLPAFVAEVRRQTKRRFDKAIVSSTVDYTPEALQQLDALPCTTLFFTHTTPIPLKNLYATPETLGPDRLAAAVGAWHRCPNHALIVMDIGTCITIDFVTKKGEYLGGNISPGLHMRLKAMHDYTAHLPLVELDGERRRYGIDTETALREGVFKGVSYELLSYIDYPYVVRKARAFVTGGDADYIFNAWRSSLTIDPVLVARGLNYILNFNIKLATKV